MKEKEEQFGKKKKKERKSKFMLGKGEIILLHLLQFLSAHNVFFFLPSQYTAPSILAFLSLLQNR